MYTDEKKIEGLEENNVTFSEHMDLQGKMDCTLIVALYARVTHGIEEASFPI